MSHRQSSEGHERRRTRSDRSPSSTPASAGSPSCTSAWSCPEEDYVYLGDDARFPYGAKSAAEFGECTRRNTAFLLDRGTKPIVIACNSAAGAGLEPARGVAAARGVEVVAVIEPEAEIAAAITDSGRVGVLATPATAVAGAPTCARSAANTAS